MTLNSAMRITQVLVLAAQDAGVAAMLEPMAVELHNLVKGIYEEQRNSRSPMPESDVLNIV